MSRLFLVLAIINTASLAITFVVGILRALWPAEFHLAHFSLGLFTSIITLLVHCIIFTYFLGTGRWVKEVALAYKIPDDNYPRTTRELKRRTFPPALIAMLITIATAASGEGARHQQWPWQVHAILAVLTVIINLWAFWIEYRDLRLNGAVLDGVMVEVERIRAEQGLPSNEEALMQE